LKSSFIIFYFILLFLFSSAVYSFSSDEMILIPEGEFLMGTSQKEVYREELPLHKVYLQDYFIDKYEVTVKEYTDFLNREKEPGYFININDKRSLIEFADNLYRVKKGYEDYPVTGVTWYGADAYARWVKKRLPTEAEWEKAARGTEGRIFPWGMEWDPLKCANSCPGGSKMLMPVGSFPNGASPYGVMDMAGNVWEWCADWFYRDYYLMSSQVNPPVPSKGIYKVIKGGSWFYTYPDNFRCARRAGKDLKCKLFNIGFRCARDK